MTQILGTVEIVPPPTGADARQRVVFGATVTVREVRTREESRYQIVGVDEVDLGDDRVSLYAPIARVLINARVGERVRFRFPAGEETSGNRRRRLRSRLRVARDVHRAGGIPFEQRVVERNDVRLRVGEHLAQRRQKGRVGRVVGP